MTVKRLAATVCATLLLVLQSLTSPDAAAQVRDQNESESVVLGEDPLIRELGPPPELKAVAQTLAADPGYRLRVVYMIPGNRTAQPEAKEVLQGFVVRMQDWFRDHMERLGYGPKTFTYEPEADGAPKIDFIYVQQPDSYFWSDYVGLWNNVLNRISATSFPIWQKGVVTLVVAETHVQEPDGTIRAGTNFVGGTGTSVSGVAMVTGETLARMSEEFLTDDRLYAGLVIPAIGPYPLVQDVSFAWFDGTTISSISSGAQGAVIHEIGHAFNLWHDFRNDYNANGNLMGNGFRGLRGSLFPRRYPADDVGLSSGSALMLDNSRFFNAGQSFTDDFAPGVEIVTSGTAVPVNGLCELSYSAYDADSLLGGALLIRGGQVVADTPLDVPVWAGTLAAYDYTPGVQDEWNVLVIDRQGNRTVSPGVRIQCAPGYNRAPRPDIHIITTWVEVGEQLRLNATPSSDPDGNWSNLAVRWDLDGDGTFDTNPTTDKDDTTTYSQPGVYQVVAELTDERGDSTVSVPIGIRVERRDVELPVVTISAADPGAAEAGLDPGSFTVSRTGVTTSALTVNYAVSGTATPGAGADYQTLAGSVVIPAGQPSASIAVTPFDDGAVEGDETVTVTLSMNAAYTLGSPAGATVTIADNDTATPAVSASPASVSAGGTVTAAWSGIAAPTATDWIGLYIPGDAHTSYITWIFVSCSQTAGVAAASGSCSFVVPATVAAGTYQLRLFANDGYTLLAISNALMVTAPGTGPALSVNPTTVASGGSVTAAWSGIAAPTATDWIGLYIPGAPHTSYITWIFVSCSQTAGVAAASGSCSFVVPATVAAGTYQLRLFANDGYTLLAISNALMVTAPGTGPALSVNPTTVASGGSVTAAWSGIAAPTATDWIGLYIPGAPHTSYITWIFVSCSQTAGVAAASGSCSFVVPATVAAGTYQLRLFANDGYTLLATSDSLAVTSSSGGRFHSALN